METFRGRRRAGRQCGAPERGNQSRGKCNYGKLETRAYRRRPIPYPRRLGGRGRWFVELAGRTWPGAFPSARAAAAALAEYHELRAAIADVREAYASVGADIAARHAGHGPPQYPRPAKREETMNYVVWGAAERAAAVLERDHGCQRLRIQSVADGESVQDMLRGAVRGNAR